MFKFVVVSFQTVEKFKELNTSSHCTSLPSYPSPSKLVSCCSRGTAGQRSAQDTQTGCQATAGKDHSVCVCVRSRVHVYCSSLCVPVSVLIIKNKHVSLPVAQASM